MKKIQEVRDYLGRLWCRAERNEEGQLDGIVEFLNDDGTLAGRAHYKNGKQDGLEEGWSKDGKIKSLRHYKDGKLEGAEELYINYSIIARTVYKDGQLVRHEAYLGNETN